VTATDLRRVSLEWFPPVIWLSLLLTPLVFVILYFLLRRSVALEVPLSAAGRRQLARSRGFALALAVAGACFLLLAAWAGAQRGAALVVGGGVFPLVLLLGGLVLSAAVILALRRGPILQVIRRTDNEAWLAGAGPEFLASLSPRHRAS